MNQLHKTYFYITLLLLVVIIFLLGFDYFRRSGQISNSSPTAAPTPIITSTPTPTNISKQIQLDNLKPNDSITSPLTIKGKIDSSWMFEGVFPIMLLDNKRNLIVQTQGQQTVPGSWTQPGMIDFQAKLNFKTNDSAGFLVFKKDNPSGLPENDQLFEIPVVFIIKNTSDTSKFCGGIANIQCPFGYICQLDGNYPDAGGKCVNKKQPYQCPDTDWIDCMPIVPEDRRYQCQKPYLDWVKINCPNFQGIAM